MQGRNPSINKKHQTQFALLITPYAGRGAQRLQRYVTEFDFRYNNCKVNGAERTDNALKGISSKRLLYGEPNQSKKEVAFC